MGIQQERSKQWKKGGRKINYHHALTTTTMQFARRRCNGNSERSNFFAIWQKEYLPTRELPGVALVNISIRQIFMGKGNTLNYID